MISVCRSNHPKLKLPAWVIDKYLDSRPELNGSQTEKLRRVFSGSCFITRVFFADGAACRELFRFQLKTLRETGIELSSYILELDPDRIMGSMCLIAVGAFDLLYENGNGDENFIASNLERSLQMSSVFLNREKLSPLGGVVQLGISQLQTDILGGERAVSEIAAELSFTREQLNNLITMVWTETAQKRSLTYG